MTNRKKPRRRNGEHEESFAERAIEAELDHAMGVANPDYDWLVEPYLEDPPDDYREQQRRLSRHAADNMGRAINRSIVRQFGRSRRRR